jgi:hypothetical protein
MLNVPLALSSTGRKQQLFFATNKLAEIAAEQLKARQRNFGNTLTNLTSARTIEASQAFGLLDKAGSKVSLISIVQAHLAQEQRRRQSCASRLCSIASSKRSRVLPLSIFESFESVETDSSETV